MKGWLGIIWADERGHEGSSYSTNRSLAGDLGALCPSSESNWLSARARLLENRSLVTSCDRGSSTRTQAQTSARRVTAAVPDERLARCKHPGTTPERCAALPRPPVCPCLARSGVGAGGLLQVLGAGRGKAAGWLSPLSCGLGRGPLSAPAPAPPAGRGGVCNCSVGQEMLMENRNNSNCMVVGGNTSNIISLELVTVLLVK